LILQAAPRGLFKKSIGVLTTGETTMWKLAAQIPMARARARRTVWTVRAEKTT